MKRFSLTFFAKRCPEMNNRSGEAIKKSEMKSETFPSVITEAMAMIGIQRGAALLLPNPTSCHGAK